MMSRSKLARMRKPFIFILARYILAALPLTPALLINVDWSGPTPLGWKIASVAGILLCAAFIEASRHARPWHTALLLMLVGLFGCYCNMLVAMKSASHASEDDLHARKTRILAVNQASSQSSQASQRRQALVEIAGETPSATYESQIQAAIAKDIRRWDSTSHCEDISAKASGTFCAEIATLRGKKTAAEQREELDRDAPKGPSEAPPSEDPFADAFPAFASGFGIHVDKANATAHLNGVRSIYLELMAGFGPMTMLLLWELIAMAGQTLSRQDTAKARTADASKTAMEAPPAAEPTVDPRVAREQQKAARDAAVAKSHEIFVADRLELSNGTVLKTGEAWSLWQAHCGARGEEPGDQRSFSRRMSKSFTHDHNNGRPRFLNVRAKVGKPTLRIVS